MFEGTGGIPVGLILTQEERPRDELIRRQIF